VAAPASRASFAKEPWRTGGGESALRLLATAAFEIRRDATTTWTAPGSEVREGGAAGALCRRERGDTAASISSHILVVACVVRWVMAGRLAFKCTLTFQVPRLLLANRPDRDDNPRFINRPVGV